MMLVLVYSLPYQIAFGAVPLASIRRPLHLLLPYQNNTKQVPLRTQEQISHTTPAIPMSLYLYCNTNSTTTITITEFSTIDPQLVLPVLPYTSHLKRMIRII